MANARHFLMRLWSCCVSSNEASLKTLITAIAESGGGTGQSPPRWMRPSPFVSRSALGPPARGLKSKGEWGKVAQTEVWSEAGEKTEVEGGEVWGGEGERGDGEPTGPR